MVGTASIRTISNTLGFIMNHPLTRDDRFGALGRFAAWQVTSLISRREKICDFADGTKLIMKRGMHSATGNIYVGLMEFDEMAFLLHFLRKEDLFVDIGANVGTYTVLASAARKARTISIEPVPSAFEYLQKNIRLNGMEGNVSALNIGIGETESILPFTSSLGSVNHVVMEGEKRDDIINLPVKALDDLLRNERPALMKIDTEGYLKPILAGAKNALSNHKLKAIIIELRRRKDAHEILLSYGFKPYRYEPFSRRLSEVSFNEKRDLIYIRDLQFVSGRVSSADKFRVLKKEV